MGTYRQRLWLCSAGPGAESEVDEVVDLDPAQCENCQEGLGEVPRLDAFIRQVCETPEFKAFVCQFNLWRKVSLGVDSPEGARFVERMLTLAGAARRRGIDILAWLTQALSARLVGVPAPPFKAS